MGVVDINLIENGWIMMAVWDRAKAGDVIARVLYLKLKAAAKAEGAVWYYGDPWPEAAAAETT
jgi:hypothetical protein